MKLIPTHDQAWLNRAWITILSAFPRGTEEWTLANSALFDGDWDTVKAIYQKALAVSRSHHQESLHV